MDELLFTEWRRDDNGEDTIRPLTDFAGKEKRGSLRELFVQISTFCGNAPKPVVLIIDEVDSASNNQVFVDFLAAAEKLLPGEEK